MSPEGDRSRTEQVRSFVALVPAPEVVDDIVAWQRSALAGRSGVRALPAASLHLTLAFLGDLDPAEVEAASRIVTALEASPVSLRLEPGLVGVPRSRPRVLAFSESGGEAAELQPHLAADLVAAGLLEASDRPFWSHLSVARVRGGALDGRGGRAEIAGLPPPPASALEGFDAVRVALYRSELRPEGASYSSLADIYLPRTRRMR